MEAMDGKEPVSSFLFFSLIFTFVKTALKYPQNKTPRQFHAQFILLLLKL